MRYLVLICGLMAAPATAGQGFTMPDCTQFLIGSWVGKGDVSFIGSQKVDNRWIYRADGTYDAKLRYVQQDGKWSETQHTKGTWEAKKAAAAKSCTITLNMKGDGYSGSSTSDIEVVDADTHKTMGLKVKRQK